MLLRYSGGMDLAGSLAYFIVLSLFPFVTLLIVCLANIAEFSLRVLR